MEAGMMKGLGTAVGLTVVLAGATACGHSASSSAAPPGAATPVTKAAYIKTEEAICAKYLVQVKAVASGGSDTASASVQKAIVDLNVRQFEDMKAVPAPPGDQAKLQAIWNGVIPAVQAVGQHEHTNIEDALGQAEDPWGALASAYGINC
jgi:hypothetical protein